MISNPQPQKKDEAEKGNEAENKTPETAKEEAEKSKPQAVEAPKPAAK